MQASASCRAACTRIDVYRIQYRIQYDRYMINDVRLYHLTVLFSLGTYSIMILFYIISLHLG